MTDIQKAISARLAALSGIRSGKSRKQGSGQGGGMPSAQKKGQKIRLMDFPDDVLPTFVLQPHRSFEITNGIPFDFSLVFSNQNSKLCSRFQGVCADFGVFPPI